MIDILPPHWLTELAEVARRKLVMAFRCEDALIAENGSRAMASVPEGTRELLRTRSVSLAYVLGDQQGSDGFLRGRIQSMAPAAGASGAEWPGLRSAGWDGRESEFGARGGWTGGEVRQRLAGPAGEAPVLLELQRPGGGGAVGGGGSLSGAGGGEP